MDYYISRVAFASVAVFVLFFLAVFLSVGLIPKHGMDAEQSKARDPDFEMPGMFLRNVGLAFGALAIGYLLYFGRIDSFLYSVISIAALVTTVAIAQAMSAIGGYSFETPVVWRRVRRKAFLQAGTLICFVYALDYGMKLIGLR